MNRVTPHGTFEAVSARGTFLGNRGRLHDEAGEMGSRIFAHRAWVCCLLEFRGRHRVINSPTSYSELFFADEAVALSAGHRPCAQCRRGAFDAFRSAWQLAHGLARPPLASTMDAELHAARLDHHGEQRTHVAQLGTLPSGVMLTLPSSPDRSALFWGGMLHPWNHAGYSAPIAADPKGLVMVLTPRPTVSVLRTGYRPVVALGRSPAGITHRELARPLADAHPRQ